MPGTFSYDPLAGTVLHAGTQMLAVTFTPTDTVDYTTVTVSTSITVASATPTITWTPPAPITYGTALSAEQFDANAGVPGTWAYNFGIGTMLGVGTQTLTVVFTPADSADYSAASASTAIVVGKATPTVQVIGGGVYDGGPVAASATVTGAVPFVNATPAASLEGVGPTLTYYAGSDASGTPLPGARLRPGPIPSWRPSPAVRIMRRRPRRRLPSPSIRPPPP